MNITYNYEIISADEQARCMEVLYSAEGYQTMHISVRLPFVGESLDAVIASFAPVQLWIEANLEVYVPSKGTTGTITPVIEEPEPQIEIPTVVGAEVL